MAKRKWNFNPQITRIRLNPEQAVLSCDCFDTGALGIGHAGPEPGQTPVLKCRVEDKHHDLSWCELGSSTSVS